MLLTGSHLKTSKETAQNCFGLPIRFTRLHELKSIAADYYRVTRDQILQRIVHGDLIHADETKVQLLKENGYLWVLTNMEEVVYIYRPDRTADFLHDLLIDFSGVLISDFFTGYDSLDCLQQKCLVHLIRDFNDDLMEHRHDEELKQLAKLFGDLLKTIVVTVDRFGLKKRNLNKHHRDVERFYLEIQRNKQRSSLVTDKYLKRLQKYRTKLFEFLNHDGIPWNNNNAERAIKPFAKYRRLVKGRISEKGLEDYLVLLSIYQTCEYKEIGFLDFLLSEKRDINEFAQAQRGKRKPRSGKKQRSSKRNRDKRYEAI